MAVMNKQLNKAEILKAAVAQVNRSQEGNSDVISYKKKHQSMTHQQQYVPLDVITLGARP